MTDIFLGATSLLSALTIGAILGTLLVWISSRQLQYALGLALVYYFTFFGGFKLVGVKSRGLSDPSLDSLESALFPIFVDETYLLTLFLYGIFFLSLVVAIRLTIDQKLGIPLRNSMVAVQVSHGRLICISLLAVLLSVGVVMQQIFGAISEDQSTYSFLRSEGSPYFTLHQLLNRIGLGALAIGLASSLAESKRKFTRFSAYSLLLALWLFFLFVLGNRNELFVAGIAGVLWYHAMGGSLARWKVCFAALLGFTALRAIEWTRGLTLADLAGSSSSTIFSTAFWNPINLATGTESVAAHVSLYGILTSDVDFTYGSSILYFVNSLVPSALLEARVPDAYSLYAIAVDAPPTQGFTIHYAAGWYLNFGVFGLIVGGLLLGACWGWIGRVSARFTRMHHRYSPLTLCAFCFFSAFIPSLMRGGPEAFKGLIFEAVAIPVLVLWISIRGPDKWIASRLKLRQIDGMTK